jgi:hypothetical protein
MKTLVYFASGRMRKEYKDLDFDKIYLVDNCFKIRQQNTRKEYFRGKIICLGMDCLVSIACLKNENVQIDYFVCLNEGLWEGGGSYAINSDMFLGYAMPLLKDNYVHIMNRDYYYNEEFRITMDWPYEMEEMPENDDRFISPFVFSNYDYHEGHAKVYQMRRFEKTVKDIQINPSIKLQILHDSIWNDYNSLDACGISFSNQGQRDFFFKKEKVFNIYGKDVDEILDYCEKNSVRRIGLTPFGEASYNIFLRKLKAFKSAYPKEINLYHLNKNDYNTIKSYNDCRNLFSNDLEV